jgi:hypothetical protein
MPMIPPWRPMPEVAEPELAEPELAEPGVADSVHVAHVPVGRAQLP